MPKNYLSELEREDGTILTIKDAEARAELAAQLQQIDTNKTNIGNVQTQANWNANNGVKNLIKLDDFSGTYLGLNVSCVNGEITISGTSGASGSLYLTGTVHHSIDSSAYVHSKFASDNVIFTGAPTTDIKDRIIIGLMKGSTYVYSFSTQTPTQDLSQYDYDNYYIYIPLISGQQYNGTWKPMLRPAFIEDDTFEPYALPNTKITPELIELVDSGAKNELKLITPYGSGITNNPNLTVTLNSDQTITVNGSATTSGVIVISNTISGKLGKYLSGRPAGITADIRLTAYSQPSWSAVGNDYNGEGATITDNGNIVIAIYVIAGQTYSNVTFKPMICSKSAWDISNKYVPHRPTYAETVDQVTATHNQANFNTNNGVKNFATINNFTYTGYYMDVPINGSLSGEVTVHIGNITSTDTDASTCALLFIYTDDSSSAIHLINRGTSTIFSANTGSYVIKSIRIYPSDTWVHSANDTVTVTNFMVAIKSIYDEAPGYQPYAISNTTITPALIECVDSGAKNVLNTKGATITPASGVTITRNSDGTFNVSRSTSGSVSNNYALVYINAGSYMLSGAPAGGSNEQWILDIRTNESESVVVGGQDTGSGAQVTIPTSDYYRLTFRLGTSYSGTWVFKPMLCSKAAWDVSQKFVPYRPTYEETVEQVATNENNISIVDITSNVTAESGYTVDNTSHLYRQGKHIFGTLIIKKASGDFSNTSQETIATIDTYAPEYQYLGISGFTNTIWAVQNIGYAFVQNAGMSGAGSITVMDTATTNNCVKIPIDYVTT